MQYLKLGSLSVVCGAVVVTACSDPGRPTAVPSFLAPRHRPPAGEQTFFRADGEERPGRSRTILAIAALELFP